VPESDEDTNTAMLVDFLNREQRTYLTSFLVGVHENFLAATYDIALVSGQREYRIPSASIAAGLKLVEKLDSQGLNPIPLFPVAQEDVFEAARRRGPGDYWLKGNTIVFVETPDATSGTVRLTYFKRLNTVVESADAGQVTAINTGTNAVTVATVPADWVSGATDYDFVQGTPHFEVLDTGSATLSGSVLTFSASLPDDLAVGDFVALEGKTPIVNAPLELHDLLVARATYVYLLARGDPKAAAALAYLDDLEERVKTLISPRQQSQSNVILNMHGVGWNRHWRGRRRLP
jgi:hypothetical protein